jgi:hypothetical protein
MPRLNSTSKSFFRLSKQMDKIPEDIFKTESYYRNPSNVLKMVTTRRVIGGRKKYKKSRKTRRVRRR